MFHIFPHSATNFHFFFAKIIHHFRKYPHFQAFSAIFHDILKFPCFSAFFSSLSLGVPISSIFFCFYLCYHLGQVCIYQHCFTIVHKMQQHDGQLPKFFSSGGLRNEIFPCIRNPKWLFQKLTVSFFFLTCSSTV